MHNLYEIVHNPTTKADVNDTSADPIDWDEVNKEKSQIRRDYMEVVESKVERSLAELNEIEKDLNEVNKMVNKLYTCF